MSLILEALRKMEQERKSRRGAGLDIRPEVLRYRAAVKQPQSKPYLLVAIGLVLLTAGIGAGILLKGNHGEEANRPVAMISPELPLAPAAPVPAPVPPAEQSVPVPAPSGPGVLQPAPMAAEPAAQPKSQPSSASAPVGRKSGTASGYSLSESAVPPQAKPLHQETSGAAQAGIPEISISGIAWQDERRMRRAVLNGTLVGEGAEVAGARVVEIRENKVRMSRGGQIFEVFFSSGFPSR